MKNFFYLIVLLFSLASCGTLSGDTESSVVAEERLYGNLPYETVRVVKVYPKNRKSEEIRGLCFIATDPESFFDTQCRSIELELNPVGGGEAIIVRTDEEGRFRIGVKKNKKFKLKVNSKKYRTVSDEIILSSGADTLIRLIKK